MSRAVRAALPLWPGGSRCQNHRHVQPGPRRPTILPPPTHVRSLSAKIGADLHFVAIPVQNARHDGVRNTWICAGLHLISQCRGKNGGINHKPDAHATSALRQIMEIVDDPVQIHDRMCSLSDIHRARGVQVDDVPKMTKALLRVSQTLPLNPNSKTLDLRWPRLSS